MDLRNSHNLCEDHKSGAFDFATCTMISSVWLFLLLPWSMLATSSATATDLKRSLALNTIHSRKGQRVVGRPTLWPVSMSTIRSSRHSRVDGAYRGDSNEPIQSGSNPPLSPSFASVAAVAIVLCDPKEASSLGKLRGGGDDGDSRIVTWRTLLPKRRHIQVAVALLGCYLAWSTIHFNIFMAAFFLPLPDDYVPFVAAFLGVGEVARILILLGSVLSLVIPSWFGVWMITLLLPGVLCQAALVAFWYVVAVSATVDATADYGISRTFLPTCLPPRDLSHVFAHVQKSRRMKGAHLGLCHLQSAWYLCHLDDRFKVPIGLVDSMKRQCINFWRW